MKFKQMSGRDLNRFALDNLDLKRRWWEWVPILGYRHFRRRVTALVTALPGSPAWLRLRGDEGRPAGMLGDHFDFDLKRELESRP